MRDDKPDYERRPGTDRDKSDELASGAITDLTDAARSAVSAREPDGSTHLRPGPAVSLHALGITPELVRTERLDLRDHVISGVHDLASLAQVARDPRTSSVRPNVVAWRDSVRTAIT